MARFDATSTGEQVSEALAESMKGKTILITGATTGTLGAEYIRLIAPHAAKIWALSRNKERTDATIAAVRKEVPNADIRSIVLDLLDLESIRSAADHVNQDEGGLPIHVLVNNVMVSPAKELNENTRVHPSNWEPQFAAHHIGHALLTSLLLPRLRQAHQDGHGPARVIQITSMGHHITGIRWDDPHWLIRPQEYTPIYAYGQSKTANILFAKGLTKRLAKDGIIGFSVNPGEIRTNGYNDNMSTMIPFEQGLPHGIYLPDGSINPDRERKSLSQGVATHIVASFDPSIEHAPGGYLEDCNLTPQNLAPHADGEENADKLWFLTEAQLGQRIIQ